MRDPSIARSAIFGFRVRARRPPNAPRPHPVCHREAAAVRVRPANARRDQQASARPARTTSPPPTPGASGVTGRWIA